ncbi:MAG: class I SAM-dependent methyltransferase [Cyanobium sp.]|nr:MAG: class I SAM-dependent methyltransferase [Cyanobium sp.]
MPPVIKAPITPPPANTMGPQSELGRRARAVLDGARYGLSFAIGRYLASAPEPLDPAFTWGFLTGRPPAWQRILIEGYPFRFQRRWILAKAFAGSHAAGIEEHYDVSNAFYRLFLDRELMLYTCADFESDSDTLETAQRRKADDLLALIRPAAGERILDLGCGWGGMMRHLHAATGEQGGLRGMTLSREQARHVGETLGYDVVLDDFITASFQPDSYDRIYGIGSIEHVRPAELRPLLQRLHRALAPDGRLVLQFFALNSDPLPTSQITGQLFFPGSALSLYSEFLLAAGNAGFEIVHDSSRDYRPTLRAWFERLVENREEAISLAGLETYNRYLVFFAVSWAFFDQNQATLHRLALEKTPATRSINA